MASQLVTNAARETVIDPHSNHTAVPTRVIAIAVDASPSAEAAFDWAISNIVRPDSDQIVLLNVRPVVSVPLAYIDLSEELKKMEDAVKKESHELLRKLAAKLPAHKYNIRGVALLGDPRDEIENEVRVLKASMLVIGSRGLDTFKRAMLGSVSDYLVHHVAVPVVIPRV